MPAPADLRRCWPATLTLKGAGTDTYSAQAFDYRSERAERVREFRTDIDIVSVGNRRLCGAAPFFTPPPLLQNHDEMLDVTEIAGLMDPRHYAHALNEVCTPTESAGRLSQLGCDPLVPW